VHEQPTYIRRTDGHGTTAETAHIRIASRGKSDRDIKAQASEQGNRVIGPPPPLSGWGGDNPPTFCCNIGKKYQNLLRFA